MTAQRTRSDLASAFVTDAVLLGADLYLASPRVEAWETPAGTAVRVDPARGSPRASSRSRPATSPTRSFAATGRLRQRGRVGDLFDCRVKACRAAARTGGRRPGARPHRGTQRRTADPHQEPMSAVESSR